MESGFRFNEKHLSQIPALQLLANLGYRYLTPEQTLTMRGGRLANVLLEEVLRDSLKRINRIQHKGGDYLFSRGKPPKRHPAAEEREVRRPAENQ